MLFCKHFSRNFSIFVWFFLVFLYFFSFFYFFFFFISNGFVSNLYIYIYIDYAL